MRIAILDSNLTHVERMCHSLRAAGYDCTPFYKDKLFVEQIKSEHFNLLLLGENIKISRRTNWLKLVREELQPGILILMLVDSRNTAAIQADLTSGVNDYVCLPLRLHELHARIHILLSQNRTIHSEEKIEQGPFVFYRYPNRVMKNNASIRLTVKEFELAWLFFKHIGQPISRAYINEAVWQTSDDEFTRTIDTHVSRVRNKLTLYEENGFRLEQVYGYGYQLVLLPAKP